MARPFTTELTRRQKAMLDWIVDFAQENQMPPTVREIGRAFGFASSSVFDYLKALERKGYVKRGDLGARSLTICREQPQACKRCGTTDVVGQVKAGRPVLAVEHIRGTVTVPKDLVRDREVYALEVAGDSMIGDGILDGDFVIIRKQETADDGDIAVVLIGDEATLKRVYREGRRLRLQPSNPTMKPIYVDSGEVRIQGKVVGVQRLLDRPVPHRRA